MQLAGKDSFHLNGTRYRTVIDFYILCGWFI